MEQNKEKNFLENKTVVVKVIPERYNTDFTSLSKDHVGRFQFPYCSTVLKLPLSKQHRGLFPVLTAEEQEFFEKKLYMTPGELSIHRKGSNPNDRDTFNFWYGFQVVLKGEEELILNLADPLDNLRYRILKVRPEIAQHWEKRLDNPEYRWALVDKSYEETANTTMADLKIEAYSELSKIRTNRIKMLDIIRALGKHFPDDTPEAVIYNELAKIVETTNASMNQITIKDFLSIIKDSDMQVKAIFSSAISKGIIRKSKGGFFFNESLLGKNHSECIEYFKLPENREELEVIKLKIKE